MGYVCITIDNNQNQTIMKTLSTFLASTSKVVTPLLFAGMMSAGPIAVGQSIDDEFGTGSTISNNWKEIGNVEGWGVSHLKLADANTTIAGKLALKPSTSMWYNDYMAPFYFQQVTGDFVFTTLVTFSGANGTSGINANSHYSLGGLMLRMPKSFTNGASGWSAGHENYISIMAGYGDNFGPCNPGAGTHIMVNNTFNGVSNMCQTLGSGNTLELRIARIGNAVILMSRVPGGTWSVIHRENRADFPAQMQIGFASMSDLDKAYTYNTVFANSHTLDANLSPDPSTNFMQGFNPDLLAGFDYGKFNTATVPANLAGVDLVNVASDNDLLSFLSFNVTLAGNGGNGGTGGGSGSTGVSSISSVTAMQVIPSLANNEFKVSAEKGLFGDVYVIDALGRVQFHAVMHGEMNVSVDCASWNSGIYFVKNGNATQRLVKE
jgi:hypothetical protein